MPPQGSYAAVAASSPTSSSAAIGRTHTSNTQSNHNSGTPPAPPLLLTKRLTSFLQSNLTPLIHTALLCTQSGKLLAHASPRPVSQLRTQSAAAASLAAVHSAAAPSVAEAVSHTTHDHAYDHYDDPHQPYSYHNDEHHHHSSAAAATASSSYHDDVSPRTTHTATMPNIQANMTRPNSECAGTDTQASPNPEGIAAVTVQLAEGTVVIRRLRCGLLFVCVGPSANSSAGPTPAADQTATSAAHDAHLTASQTLQLPSATAPQPEAGGSHALISSSVGAPSHFHASAASRQTTPPSQAARSLPESDNHNIGGGNTAAAAAGSGGNASAGNTASASSASGGSGAGEAAGGAASVLIMRRRAEELARWLDDKLGTLLVPEEGVGGATS